MKKLALISTYCNTEEKEQILIENIIKLKNLGLDVMVLSPLTLKPDTIQTCDYFFYTKENPLLVWPTYIFFFWHRQQVDEHHFVTMQRSVPDYGWAALYQVKKLSQIALTFDYDIFYHLIYDLVIDKDIENEIKSDIVNVVYSRRDPKNPEVIFEVSLHFMIFDRTMMSNIEKDIILDDYIKTNSFAEGEALKWKNKYDLTLSKIYVKDKIFFWENTTFFNYPVFDDMKMFVSKNPPDMKIWLGFSDPSAHEEILTTNLKLVFYNFSGTRNIEISVNGKVFQNIVSSWDIIELPVDSQNIQELIICCQGKCVDFTQQYSDIMLNQIYYDYNLK